MSASDHDADLERALALSMDDDSITLHEDDEKPRPALALPRQTTIQGSSSPAPASMSDQVRRKVEQISQRPIVVPSSTPPMESAKGFKGMDRKAMEEERLARLSKRKRIPSPEEPAKRLAIASDGGGPQKHNINSPWSDVTLQYPRGVIKRTFASKYPRTNDITIDELLEAPNVHIAVISSFMWDAPWLHKKLDPAKIKQIWVMNAKGRDVQYRWVQEMKDTGVPNLKLHFPPMHGMIHSMHSKYLLLFGKDKLRFAVPTANMTCIDWGEVTNEWQPGVMENSVFLIDLPRLKEGVVADTSNMSKFGQELVYFLEQQETPRNVIDGVLKFDFSQTAHLAFVHSLGGSHKPEAAHPTGLPGLSHAIRELQLGDVNQLELDYAASSLGAVNDNLLQRIHLAARGVDFDETTPSASVRKQFRIYFPTKETVEGSIGGPDCGGIISLTSTCYNAPTFPRECLRDYDSTRRGMLSHNKLLFARGCRDDGRRIAWAYVGSANISESAWGGQKILKGGSLGSLNIRNWECGVVMPVSEEKVAGANTSEGTVLPPMEVFENTVEVPFHYPGTEYGRRRPWYFRAG